MISTEGILPATRFAVDAYVHFVASALLEAIASSLTELFSPRSSTSAFGDARQL